MTDLLIDEDYFKAKVIDYLIGSEKGTKIIFGSEIRFGSKGNYADLIAIEDDNIISFEIKADNDDLRRIEEQLIQYRIIWDYVSVVTSEKHIDRIQSVVPEDCGLYILSKDHKLRVIREAERNKQSDKFELLNTIPAKFLQSHFGMQKGLNAEMIRNLLSEKTRVDIKYALLKYLKKKLYYGNITFRKELGNTTHYEDIELIKFRSNQSICY